MTCGSVFTHTHIYVYIERERETHVCVMFITTTRWHYSANNDTLYTTEIE